MVPTATAVEIMRISRAERDFLVVTLVLGTGVSTAGAFPGVRAANAEA